MTSAAASGHSVNAPGNRRGPRGVAVRVLPPLSDKKLAAVWAFVSGPPASSAAPGLQNRGDHQKFASRLHVPFGDALARVAAIAAFAAEIL
jgi:hypothetical protein